MTPLTRWAAVSAVTLTAVELSCATRGTLYTGLYRDARAARGGWLLPVAAGVVFAHLEGWLPARMDPFHQAGRVVAGLTAGVRRAR